jgi:hypothetical protein
MGRCVHTGTTPETLGGVLLLIHLVDVRNGSKEINLLNIRPTCSIEAKLVAGLVCWRRHFVAGALVTSADWWQAHMPRYNPYCAGCGTFVFDLAALWACGQPPID